MRAILSILLMPLAASSTSGTTICSTVRHLWERGELSTIALDEILRLEPCRSSDSTSFSSDGRAPVASPRRLLESGGESSRKRDSAPTAVAPADMLSYEASLHRVQPGKDRRSWKTMVPPAKLHHLYQSVLHNISAVEHPVEGAFVECGVWRGGATMMMVYAELAALARDGRSPHRDVWLFDTFEGMPMPGKNDGVTASHRWHNANSSAVRERSAGWSTHDMATGGDGAEYTDAVGRVRWNYGPMDVVRENIESTTYPAKWIHYVKGKVEDTLTNPGQVLPAKIALLRLDTDWYTSTKLEFEILVPRLSPGGLLIVDDYCRWMGARRATKEFLAAQGMNFFFEHVGKGAVCFAIWKRTKGPDT